MNHIIKKGKCMRNGLKNTKDMREDIGGSSWANMLDRRPTNCPLHWPIGLLNKPNSCLSCLYYLEGMQVTLWLFIFSLVFDKRTWQFNFFFSLYYITLPIKLDTCSGNNIDFFQGLLLDNNCKYIVYSENCWIVTIFFIDFYSYPSTLRQLKRTFPV